jgi:hypothetical protein
MTSEEKFKAILPVFKNYYNSGGEMNVPIAWIYSFFDDYLKNNYKGLYVLISKLQSQDDWGKGTLVNLKILAVELIYSQFVKDGLIIDDSQAVQSTPKR